MRLTAKASGEGAEWVYPERQQGFSSVRGGETGGVGRGLLCLSICPFSNTALYLVLNYMQARLLLAPCPSVGCRIHVRDHLSHVISCSSDLVIEVMFVRQPTNAGMLHYQIYC